MAKDPAKMSHAERMAMLMHELHSSSALSTANEILDLIRHEWLDVIGVRDMAARRQGVAAPPVEPLAVPAPSSPAKQPNALFDGTIEGLANVYRLDKRSAFSSLHFRTRENYEALIKRLVAECGAVPVFSLDEDHIRKLYSGWSADGKTAMAHSLAGQLRRLANFGDSILKDEASERLALVLHRMQFDGVKPRLERLTDKHVEDIIEKAHEMGLPSIALVQAFQSDCKLRQKDVVGEWLPESEPGDSEITHLGKKWLRGLRWESIDSKLMLHHAIGSERRRLDFTFNLHKAVRVLKEFRRLYSGQLPTSGPVIVSERTAMPWSTVDFRRQWRIVARAAGVPENVRNMDSSLVDYKDGDVDADEIPPGDIDTDDMDLTLELGHTAH